MKLYREGSFTSSKNLEEYFSHRYRDAFGEPGKGATVRHIGISINAPERPAHVNLLIEEQDVIALFVAFLKAQPGRVAELLAGHVQGKDQQIKRLEEERSRLRAGLRRLRDRVSDELRQDIEMILRRKGESK
jgi:hypothetical protein